MMEYLATHTSYKPSNIKIAFGVATVWLLLHAAFFDFFIYHDSWKHLFPFLFGITKQAECGSLPSWLGMIDNGSPLIIVLISSSLTQVLLVPYLLLIGCMKPDVLSAVYAFKAQIYVTYAGFAFGMFVMGITLFRNRISAIYLFAATLFAGMCLDHAHSNQIGAIVFWAPWVVAATRLGILSTSSNDRALWVNAVIFFVCAQALDQYPHFVMVSVSAGIMVFLLPNVTRSLDFIKVTIIKLWPAAVAIGLTVIQLVIIRTNIVDYQPSLRSGLIVIPEQFGETGFLQPTAFIASFFPLTFVHGFDTFAAAMGPIAQKLGAKPGERWFIFQLDALLMVVGLIPMLLAAFFAFSKAEFKLRLGMASFILIMLAVSLQQTKLYLALFHVPFFNLFRSYFLFTPFAVFGLLVMSAYGLDRLQDADAAERKLAGKRACIMVLSFALVSLLLIALLFKTANRPAEMARYTVLLLTIDVSCITVAILMFRRAFLAKADQRPVMRLVAATIILQTVSSAGLYFLVGESRHTIYERFGLEHGLNGPEKVIYAPGHRKVCTKFPECYLADYATVSLNTDLNGTFLRNTSEPVFYAKEIGLEMVGTLTGLNGPSVWISSSINPKLTRKEVVDALASASSKSNMPQPTFVISNSLNTAARDTDPDSSVKILRWSGDSILLSYSSNLAAYIFVASNWDKHWSAKMGNKELEIHPANLGGIAIAVPAGHGEFKLQYSNTPASFVWITRYLLVIAAIFSAVIMALRLRKICIIPAKAQVEH